MILFRKIPMALFMSYGQSKHKNSADLRMHTLQVLDCYSSEAWLIGDRLEQSTIGQIKAHRHWKCLNEKCGRESKDEITSLPNMLQRFVYEIF